MDPVHSSYATDPDMAELVREFALELPGRADTLERLLAASELQELGVLAHQLKGAGGGYGFAPITEVAAKLEQALRSGAAEPVIKDRTAELCATLRAVAVPEKP